MRLTIYPITPSFAAEIGDVDLSQSLDAETVAKIKQVFWDYAVLIFRSQELTEEQHPELCEVHGADRSDDRRMSPQR